VFDFCFLIEGNDNLENWGPKSYIVRALGSSLPLRKVENFETRPLAEIKIKRECSILLINNVMLWGD
jgi:hypothetical protein